MQTTTVTEEDENGDVISIPLHGAMHHNAFSRATTAPTTTQSLEAFGTRLGTSPSTSTTLDHLLHGTQILTPLPSTIGITIILNVGGVEYHTTPETLLKTCQEKIKKVCKRGLAYLIVTMPHVCAADVHVVAGMSLPHTHITCMSHPSRFVTRVSHLSLAARNHLQSTPHVSLHRPHHRQHLLWQHRSMHSKWHMWHPPSWNMLSPLLSNL